MGVIIDGKELASKYEEKVKKEVKKLNEVFIEPTLAVILVGSDEASQIYVRNKKNACERVGIKFQDFFLDETVSETELIVLINELNEDKNINGILIQSPLPNHIDFKKCCAFINPEKDIDGFHPLNIGKLLLKEKTFLPCTAKAVFEILKSKDIKVAGKNIVIVGRSNIVGKPLANILLNENATVTICHSKTKDLANFTKCADIVISATGVSNLIKEYMVKDKAVVIDVGITRNENGLCGDVDFINVKDKCSFITPVPKGVGPMTIAMLLENVIEATINQNGGN